MNSVGMCRQLSLVEVMMMQLIPNVEQLPMLHNRVMILSRAMSYRHSFRQPGYTSFCVKHLNKFISKAFTEGRWHANTNTIVVIGGFRLLITCASIAVGGISCVCPLR